MLKIYTGSTRVLTLCIVLLAMFITFNVMAQKNNEPQIIELEGNISIEQLSEIPKFRWKDTAPIKFNQQELDTLKSSVNDYRFLVFIGTWCSDTHIQIPQFIKLLKLSNFSFQENALTFYGLRLDKKSKEGFEKPYNIEFVPTIIVFKNGEEIGRIIEKPKQNLLTDLLKIIQ